VPAALESDSAASAVVVAPPAAGVVFVALMAGPALLLPLSLPPETVMASFIPEAQWAGVPQMK
jgi:hypothetical protein